MTTAPTNPALDDIELAYEKRRDLADRLQKQDAMIGQMVRDARAGGATWGQIAEKARTSDVAVLKAARRPDPAKRRP